MKRILSLLLALIMTAGACLCISSCEEAGDTSSPKTESDTSSYVPKGRGIILNSEVGEMWNDMFVTEKYPVKCIATTIDGSGEEQPIKAGRAFPNIYGYEMEIKELLLSMEEHITGVAKPHFADDTSDPSPLIPVQTFTLLDYLLEDVSEGVPFGPNQRIVRCSFFKDNVFEIEICGGNIGTDPVTAAFMHDVDYDEIESLLMKKFNRPVKMVDIIYM